MNRGKALQSSPCMLTLSFLTSTSLHTHRDTWFGGFQRPIFPFYTRLSLKIGGPSIEKRNLGFCGKILDRALKSRYLISLLLMLLPARHSCGTRNLWCFKEKEPVRQKPRRPGLWATRVSFNQKFDDFSPVHYLEKLRILFISTEGSGLIQLSVTQVMHNVLHFVNANVQLNFQIATTDGITKISGYGNHPCNRGVFGLLFQLSHVMSWISRSFWLTCVYWVCALIFAFVCA